MAITSILTKLHQVYSDSSWLHYSNNILITSSYCDFFYVSRHVFYVTVSKFPKGYRCSYYYWKLGRTLYRSDAQLTVPTGILLQFQLKEVEKMLLQRKPIVTFAFNFVRC